MTDAEINKAVAEAAGWRMVRLPDTPNEDHRLARGRHPDVPDDEYEDEGVFALDCCPNYANSLDAIVPVVREWIQKIADGDGTIRLYWEQGVIEAEIEAYPDEMVNKWFSGDAGHPARALCLAFLQAVEAAKEKA